MKINIKATGLELDPAVSEYVLKKIGAVNKYLGEATDVLVQVEVGRTTEHHQKGEVFKAEVHLIGSGFDHYAVAEKEDLFAAIDEVKDEIGRELRKQKGKRFALAKRSGQAIKNILKGFTSWRRKR